MVMGVVRADMLMRTFTQTQTQTQTDTHTHTHTHTHIHTHHIMQWKARNFLCYLLFFGAVLAMQRNSGGRVALREDQVERIRREQICGERGPTSRLVKNKPRGFQHLLTTTRRKTSGLGVSMDQHVSAFRCRQKKNRRNKKVS